ncbi:MAG: DUF1080 domain-containing protein [Tannerella sp.]|jgi:hypothetical protein|nr:DUF1080 domain-containing protein [Tannerella sp.]
MYRIYLKTVFSLLVAGLLQACGSHKGALSGNPWTALLDTTLSQWEVFIGVPNKDTEIQGYIHDGQPVGLRDPKGVYSVKMEHGEPVLHITGEIDGGLTSLKSYENYHLRFQFRWGLKRWAPRSDGPRDSGLLYHCVGKHGAFGNVWMRSVEYQIQENDVGDFFPLCGSGADFPAKIDGSSLRFTPGADFVPCFGRVMRGMKYAEKPDGEWNTSELIVVGDRAVHILNGQIVNVLANIRYKEKVDGEQKEIPLVAGKLQIQSEFAEIEYRRIEIKAAGKLPYKFDK